MQMLTITRNSSHHLVSELFHRYAEIIIAHEESPDCLFESFCELRGFDLFSQLSQYYLQHVLNFLSMMLINLKKEQSIIYTMSQPLLSQLIDNPPKEDEGEAVEQYISLLKSLATRLDASKVYLFFNCKGRNTLFPLAWRCAEFTSHPDCMLQTGCMTALLKIMKGKKQ